MVSQDPYIFDETARFNILYGRPDASRRGGRRCQLRLAYAEAFVCALPQGYETMVGDRGARLSGGKGGALFWRGR